MKDLKKLDALNDDERAIVERALQAQEKFRRAPEVFLSEDSEDELRKLVELYAPDCLDKYDSNGKLKYYAKKRAFYSARKNLVQHASQGYVPVLDDTGQFVVNSGGDVLCWQDRDLFDKKEKRRQNESTAMVRELHKDLSTDKIPGEAASNRGDIRDAKLQVSTEVIDL